MDLHKRDIELIIKDDEWTFLNKQLYKLCSDNFKHKHINIIMAKVCIIGRVYAASIERRHLAEGDEITNDQFYKEVVAPGIKKSDIDKWLSRAKQFEKVTEKSLPIVLEAHWEVMNLFKDISKMEKRSLASKYLHFHLPNLFYIYDSRAVKGLRGILPRFRLKNKINGYDEEYSKFCQKLFYLQKEIEKEFGKKLTTRQLDRLLLLEA